MPTTRKSAQGGAKGRAGKPSSKFGYGWVPDLPDQRDHCYAAPLAGLTAKAPLPAKIDLRKQCPAVYNQGQIGSCTANAIAGAFGV